MGMLIVKKLDREGNVISEKKQFLDNKSKSNAKPKNKKGGK